MNTKWQHVFLRFGLIFVLASSHLWATEPEPFLDAKAVATHLGEYVKFQDIVTAVSKSRSKDGYYMSFGAPFPNQVLSVWVTTAVFDKLPNVYPLIGRTVRIEGWLKKSSTGPMLNLDDPAQYQLLAADERVLAKEQLDGSADRAQFSASVQQYFFRGDYAVVEDLGNELTSTRERLSDGTWLLDDFYRAFRLSNGAAPELVANTEQGIARWLAKYPNSSVAVLVRAGFFLDQASQSFSVKTPELRQAGLVRMHRLNHEAQQILESAPVAARSSPIYHLILLQIARREASRDDYMKLFQAASAGVPDYFAYYFETAAYLASREGEWEKFAEEQRVRIGGDDGDALYARIAWAMSGFDRDVIKHAWISWPTTAHGFEVLIQQHPSSAALRSIYANFAWRIGDRARLKAALAQLQAPDMTIWVNQQNVQIATAFANSEEPAEVSSAPLGK